MKRSTGNAIAVLLILLALGLSLAYLFDGLNHFDGDEAIVGLMARHILQGKIPVYFYGQGYMGSLEALVAAGWFVLLGPSITALKLAPLTFYIFFLILQYRLVRSYGGLSAALLTLAITVVFSHTIILWSTKARGGFTAVLFWGTLAYLPAFRLIDGFRAGKIRWRDCLMLGAAAGLGFWTCGMVVYYYCPIALYFLVRGAREVGPGLKAIRKIWAEGKERRLDWRPWIRRAIGAIFILISIYLLFALAALIRGEIDVSPFALRITSHQGGRDLLRAGVLLLAGATWLAWKGTPKKTWPGLIRRFPSRYPHLAAGGGALLVYLLISAGINLVFRASEEYEYGHHTTVSPVENLETAGDNFSLLFGRLLPAVTGISRVSFKFDPGDTPLLRAAAKLNLITLAAAFLSFALIVKRRPALTGYRKLEFFFALSALSCLLALVFTSQVQDTTAYRYLIPMASWLPYFLAVFIIRAGKFWRPAGPVLAAAVLGGHIVQLVPEILHPRPTSAEPAVPMIIKRLTEAGVSRARADYWIAYPIDFLTGEEIIAAPYFSQDRYPPYTRAVEKADEVAYVFRGFRHPRRLELQRVLEQDRVAVREEKHRWGYLLLTRKERNPR